MSTPRIARKRNRDPSSSAEPRSKKSHGREVFSLLKMPFMLRVEICRRLDLVSQDVLRRTSKAGYETVLHLWKSQRRLVFSHQALERYFAPLPNTFSSLFTIRHELVALFAWLQQDSICELDFREIKTVDWRLFQGIVEDEYGPGVCSAVLRKVSTLHLAGCFVTSDDIYAAAEIMPDVETISISHKRMAINEDEELKQPLPMMETRGRVKTRRQTAARLLTSCFPRLRVIKFY